MASFHRPTNATHVINEKITIDTTDHEDHTFSGIAFPVKCKSILPVDKIIITSVSVRGDLGPITVWVTKHPNQVLDPTPSPPLLTPQAASSAARVSNVPYHLRSNVPRPPPPISQTNSTRVGKLVLAPKHWTQIYNRTHRPSRREFCELTLDTPVILRPGQACGIYIHSTLPQDTAIVYDRKQKSKTYQDDFITVYPGRAHVSTETFGQHPIWGYGAAWRNNREFVGRLSYGVVYKLWNPTSHYDFGGHFQQLAIHLFACQRHWSSPLSALPDDCIFYILNMCRWDWMKDDYKSVKKAARKKRDLAIREGIADVAEDARVSASSMSMAVEQESDLSQPVLEDQQTCKGSCEKEGNVESHEQNQVLDDFIANTSQNDDGNVDEDFDKMSTSDGFNSEDDSDYDEDADEMSESDEDDGYTDHSSKRTFRFEDFDEYASNDEAEEQDRRMEEERRQLEQRRATFWTHNHGRLMRLFLHRQGVPVDSLSNDDDDDDEDYVYDEDNLHDEQS